jgi:hypothetical protein
MFEGLGIPLSATDREAGMTDITARPLVTPAVHYRDATEAVRWLTNTLGLERSWVYPETGRIQHAELRWGSGVVLWPPGPRRLSRSRKIGTTEGGTSSCATLRGRCGS